MKVHSRRFLVPLFLLPCFAIVSCRNVDGVVKGTITLPCTYQVPDPSVVSIFWRSEKGNIVLDIKSGREDLTNQHMKYKGRVSSFPDNYKTGNFSILLKDVRQEDAGTYVCQILPQDGRTTVNLTVSDNPDLASRVVPPSDGAASRSCLHVFILSSLNLLLLYVCQIN
ncbi:hypothetical protein XENOCAPTIV_017242 [Xenoophorus captivus]|uniref:Ig-like domain-containing protein n=1 Tax=Xenoophorus captivus TaxID=1517983 RepID=A0ABV0R276_9TELE